MSLCFNTGLSIINDGTQAREVDEGRADTLADTLTQLISDTPTPSSPPPPPPPFSALSFLTLSFSLALVLISSHFE